MATQASTTIQLGDGSLVVLNALGANVSASAQDTGNRPSKRGVVLTCTVGAQEVDVLVRFSQRHDGTLFLDLVVDSSVANLTSRVAALNVAGHVSGTKDVTDGNAMTKAGGS